MLNYQRVRHFAKDLQNFKHKKTSGAVPNWRFAAMDDAEDRGHLYGYGDPTAKRSKLQDAEFF